MKVYLVGHKGWIGQKYVDLFKKLNIECVYSEWRAESEEMKVDIVRSKATHVLCCMGRTHGTRDGTKFTTIDYLEHPEKLHENINDNLFSPLSLALLCQQRNIHFTYIGTGCIFTYDDKHSVEDGVPFFEENAPNFFGSNYSIVKGFTDMLMKQTKTLNLRIRMPITDEIHPRNFITKITNYEKICSIKNSMSVLDDLLPISIDMMKENMEGTYNFTNPGAISHNEILEMYRDIVDPTFKWKNFTEEEQNEILLGQRSNNTLSVNKLNSVVDVPHIKKSVFNTMHRMKERTTAHDVGVRFV